MDDIKYIGNSRLSIKAEMLDKIYGRLKDAEIEIMILRNHIKKLCKEQEPVTLEDDNVIYIKF